jgi:hypothetical protein
MVSESVEMAKELACPEDDITFEIDAKYTILKKVGAMHALHTG